jgi:hypothetical protein
MILNWFIIYYYAYNEKNIQYNKLKWKTKSFNLHLTSQNASR